MSRAAHGIVHAASVRTRTRSAKHIVQTTCFKRSAHERIACTRALRDAAPACAVARGSFATAMKKMRDACVAGALERLVPDDLRETAQHSACVSGATKQNAGRCPASFGSLPRDAAGGDQPSSSTSAAYASGSSRSFACSGSLASITNSQPSPNASSLIVSGLSASAVFTAVIVPDTGA